MAIPQTPEIRAFRSSKVLVESLKNELAQPGITAALKALATMGRPRQIPAFQVGTPHDTTIAHDHCEMVGFNRAIQVLESMTFTKDEEAPADQQEEELPFEHALPESLRKKPRA